jgi:hypothetical protein
MAAGMVALAGDHTMWQRHIATHTCAAKSFLAAVSAGGETSLSCQGQVGKWVEQERQQEKSTQSQNGSEMSSSSKQPIMELSQVS